MEVIKVVATPDAYEWVMNTENPVVTQVLAAARRYVLRGFTDERDKEAICFSGGARICLRILRAQSPDEESFIIITQQAFGNVNEMLKNSIPVNVA